MKLISFSLLCAVCVACAEQSYVIEGKETESVRIHVVEFASEENAGFEIIGGEAGSKGLSVSNCYSDAEHLLVVNGAYFDGNLNPVGFCRIDYTDINTEVAPRLSGYLTISESGEISMFWKSIPPGIYRDILQSGPFIIDPGGVVGIHTRTGLKAKRTVIAQTNDGKILILTTSDVYLYDLAQMLNEQMPEIERALNLDGGPSVGLVYQGTVIENINPVANVIRKRR